MITSAVLVLPKVALLLALFLETLLASLLGAGRAYAAPPAEGSASAPGDAALTGLAVRVATHWSPLLIGGALVLTAYLVNRFAAHKRKRIRRTAILYAFYVVSYGLAFTCRVGGLPIWAERLQLATDLLQAFTLINLLALAIFDFALPKASVQLVSITSDLLVGLAYIITAIGVFRTAGMNLSSVIATSAIVSGVLALSLQATLGNILGGVALQLDGSIHVGDWIQLESGKQGRVREIHWRHTVVETRDWDTIIVPNSALLAGNITILGKRNGAYVPHRMWVYFNVDYRHSPSRVMDVVREALHAAPIERVASDPPPSVICMDFAKDGRDSFGYYAVRYWLTDLAVDDPTSSAVRARIHAALKRAGIPLARPASTVFYAPDDDNAEKERTARHRGKRVAALHTMDLFKVLTEEELTFVSDRLLYAPFAPGETMTRQGAVAHWLYIMITGKADIRARLDDGPPKHVASLTAPAYFGEMGLMTGAPRSADVVALTDVDCYRLDKEGFEKIIHERPEIATAMSHNMAQRKVELDAARLGLDEDQKRRRQETEAADILERIQSFFGLERDSTRPSTFR